MLPITNPPAQSSWYIRRTGPGVHEIVDRRTTTQYPSHRKGTRPPSKVLRRDSSVGLHLGAMRIYMCYTLSGHHNIWVFQIIDASLDQEDLKGRVSSRKTGSNYTASGAAFGGT